MKIPKLINIAGHNIKVVRKKTLKSDGVPCCGLALLVEDKIELASMAHGSKLSNDQKATSFLHESLHIISALHSLGLSEKQVTKLELALYQFLHDNKLRF
jgi:hypothetical protein